MNEIQKMGFFGEVLKTMKDAFEKREEKEEKTISSNNMEKEK
jgi:hypothetical protein